MAESMSHRERVMATLQGDEVDRPPVSMWRHFYEKEHEAEGLVEAMLAFQHKYDWDFVKLNPRAHYHAEDWGVKYDYSGDPLIPPICVDTPVRTPADWERIEPLDVHGGALGEHLEALRRIARDLGREAPVLMTVFTPLSIASRLVESEQAMLAHLREHPAKVHAALEVITETFARFVRECLAEGADGIFFATTSWASRRLLSEEEYQEFGRPYDLRVLVGAAGASFNLLHVCRSENMLPLLVDYPVQALNWDARDPWNPTLTEGRRLTSKAIVGGINHLELHRMSPAQAAEQTRAARAEAGSRGFMVGPGCTVSPHTAEEQLRAIKAAVAHKQGVSS